jgi:glycosyltransferase involved in cell wall biosynthesis
MPRFSLVVPTLKRSDTLRRTLATLVVQTYNDFEIVVQSNSNDPATEAVIKEFNDFPNL